MSKGKEEGVEIARLLSDEGCRVIGLVHLWNTAELTILWLSDERNATAIDPPLRPETIEGARVANADAVFGFLEALSKRSRSDDQPH